MTRINLSELLEDHFSSDTIEVTTSVRVEDFLDHLDDVDLDFDDLLAQSHQVGFIWSLDDVKQQRPDLTDEQCWDVLKRCHADHDADLGINWNVIDMTAHHLYGWPAHAACLNDVQ